MAIISKTCTECNQELPLVAFQKTSGGKHGVHAKCLPCLAAKRKAKYEADAVYRESRKSYAATRRRENKEKLKAERRAYYEANKSKVLADNKNYRDNSGYRESNRERLLLTSKLWALDNPERRRAALLRRRVLVKGPKIKGEDIALIWRSQGGACVYCKGGLGASPRARHAYHVDHIHPLSKGGSNSIDNLQCLCPSCNLKKGAKLPHIFVQELGRLSP